MIYRAGQYIAVSYCIAVYKICLKVACDVLPSLERSLDSLHFKSPKKFESTCSSPRSQHQSTRTENYNTNSLCHSEIISCINGPVLPKDEHQ